MLCIASRTLQQGIAKRGGFGAFLIDGDWNLVRQMVRMPSCVRLMQCYVKAIVLMVALTGQFTAHHAVDPRYVQDPHTS